MSRFDSRLRQVLLQSPPRQPRPPNRIFPQPLKVGLLGPFSGLLTFSSEHFRAAPSDVEIHLFDVAHEGMRAEFLEPIVAGYVGFDERDAHELVANAVNDANLDLLLVIGLGARPQELISLIDTPCIGYLCTGTDILHHNGIDFHVFCQPQADYFLRDDRLFCAMSRSFFGNERVYEGALVLDASGLNGSEGRAWRDREPLIAFHGSLYKLAAREFIETMCRLVADNDDVEFVYMGPAGGDELSRIEVATRRFGVASRFHYLGSYSRVRTGSESFAGQAGWQRMCQVLSRARLAPDPWPVGGSSSRMEAYMLGTPTAHMRVRFDSECWGRRQHALVELPLLLVPEASVTTISAYIDLCNRCLRDEPFAQDLVAQQLAVAAAAVDGRAYWQQILRLYRRWREDVGLDRAREHS